ncbi:hypothetical protein [Aureivirga marina]|uniref:hypothetical protein n=1 Tax=Aureivirga marina TaxID=1182451 RepID=UPI0018CA6ED8|nr:hypothetical protein [Aureivirga marina]
MRAIKYFFGLFFILITASSCVVDDDFYRDGPNPGITLDELLNTYSIWYVDYDRTEGPDNIPFLSKAFTISFQNGRLYANNNLVGIGQTGNGLGVQIGYYDAYGETLEVFHDLDGRYDFYVDQLANNRIRLVSKNYDVSYYLIGYHRSDFDYNRLFYDNIEYFLQEYRAWEKTYTSQLGALNEFDNENFLRFTPENLTTFYSSQDPVGTDIDLIQWDYEGNYEVFDVQGYDDLKILRLDYDFFNDNEEFELTVINDSTISLYHVESGTTYHFQGRQFIPFLRENNSNAREIKKERERFKVERKMKTRKSSEK